jgi:transposase-like protein
MYKHIPEDIHVKALNEALTLSDVEAIAKKYGISDQTIRRKYKLILSLIPSLIWLSPNNIPFVNELLHQLKAPCRCPQCDSPNVSKNGKLRLVNWAKRLLKKIIPSLSNDKEDVQRFICNNCGCQIHSDEHNTLKQIRTSTRLFVDKFICLLRFKEGLSLRSISRIIGFAFGINASLGYLSKFTNIIGQKAQDKMEKLSLCKATKKAIVAIIDETFPKIFHKSVFLGLVICEHGLIRAIGCVKRSSASIKGLLNQSMGQSFCPSFLLGDFHPSYTEVAKKLGLTRLTDFVHAIRHLYKLVRIHSGKVRLSLKDTDKFSPKQRKEMLKLKKKLLRKQVMPIIQTLFKGFKKQYRAVGHLYIIGALEELQRLTEQFPSLNSLYKAMNKFVQKYLPTWALQMELDSSVPTTSNSVESKNSILKIFSRRIKAFYSKASLLRFFSAVALWENFDVKERGPYKGTSAIERAGIDLHNFGAANFFEAVELESVSQHNSNTIESNKIIFYILKQVTQQAA